ncbi:MULTISPECIES: tyrosine-type recombinase/integrase [unclassified Streptomyces]|uniref:tyrosine-type recombinase/integrase n=1 Tax=unclassified Streptomyces TaxID=2593676 RepID=UPI0011653E54|nr:MULTISPECIES: tyrosine-type recombinase/integrase [unclassified Streptomyces]QDN54323.1 tyrosine-type recombinase/integrase [Streptomyces sp. S1D4-20]QDN64505.1 tyrosine-type recombinase/integrase [Streptomyces sp. S1D4-14]QDN74824.1 tyrosine-type recombinase/integrase [Streptomyces sp. S1A1-7]QDO55578.1 tyrosine-type recombinase/integrase [Streptomyces sp. RLB3-5]QDO57155.1 tyrosine-type recombinase/integrase [Streptomyces sp. RLB1-8]
MSKSSPTTPPLDREAKRRLAVIRHVEEVSGNVAMSCRYFGISRQAYYTWYRRYQAEGVEGLRTRSKAPKTCPNATHVEVVGKIIYLRQNYHFGPEKIAMYLKRYHDVTISKAGVWRILNRLDMGRLPASQRYKRHDRRWKRYEKQLPGHRVQIDVDDEMIRRNPCRIKGADSYDVPERPVLSVTEVFGVADAIAPRYRLLVLLAAFTTLRFGELAALRRKDIDLAGRLVVVRRAQAELQDGRLFDKAPKSAAGVRTVSFPGELVDAITLHLECYAAAGQDGHVFVGPQGGQLRRSNFRDDWVKARKDAGVTAELHFHDLRHTGNTLASTAGASTRELMTRMGHSSSRAALIYQHMTSDRVRAIADRLGTMIREGGGGASGHGDR